MKRSLIASMLILSLFAVGADKSAAGKLANAKRELKDLEAALKKSNDEVNKSSKKTISRRRIKETDELQKKIAVKTLLIESLEQDAIIEKGKIITLNYENSIKEGNERRTTNEKELLKKGGLSAQGIVFGTSIADYPNTHKSNDNESSGVAFYYFNLVNAKIPVPKVMKDHDLEFQLIVDTRTKKVFGCLLQSKEPNPSLKVLAVNAARAKCLTVKTDKPTSFVGIQQDGVEISVYGGSNLMYGGKTRIYYCDPFLKEKAVVKAATDSGF